MQFCSLSDLLSENRVILIHVSLQSKNSVFLDFGRALQIEGGGGNLAKNEIKLLSML